MLFLAAKFWSMKHSEAPESRRARISIFENDCFELELELMVEQGTRGLLEFDKRLSLI